MRDLRFKNRAKRLLRMLINTIYLLLAGKEKSIMLNVSMEQIGNTVAHHNVGDDINFYLVQKLSGKKVFNLVDVLNVFRFKPVMCIGSVIDWMTTHDSIIWGTGVRDNSNELRTKPSKVFAVRGPLTRQYLLKNGVEFPEIYGDPALLLPNIYPPQICLKRYKIGIILHKNDIGNEDVIHFVNENESVTLIDIQNYKSWCDVIDKIQECELIISSSLHGIIFSDAYKIPNVWIKFSDETFDGSFKYLDYLMSVGRQERYPLEWKKDLSLEQIYELKTAYSPIFFDTAPLLSVCPFLSK